MSTGPDAPETEPEPGSPPGDGHDIVGDESIVFECPRCHETVSHRFYGPCPRCVGELRATVSGEAADVAAPAYEPKMNVTPNAVALKDD